MPLWYRAYSTHSSRNINTSTVSDPRRKRPHMVGTQKILVAGCRVDQRNSFAVLQGRSVKLLEQVHMHLHIPSLASKSASISGHPSSVNILETVDLPDAIPPVNPTRNMIANRRSGIKLSQTITNSKWQHLDYKHWCINSSLLYNKPPYTWYVLFNF